MAVEADFLLNHQGPQRAADLGVDQAAMVVDHPLKRAGAGIKDSDLAVGTGGEGIDGGCAHRWDLTVIHGRDILRLPPQTTT